MSFVSWTTDGKTIDGQLNYQVDIGSAQKFNSPKYLIVAHQTAVRKGVPNKTNKDAVFGNPNVRKYFVDFDEVRYPRDGVTIDCATNDYLDEYKHLILFYKAYVAEELLSLFLQIILT